jgi:hypothetical protein
MIAAALVPPTAVVGIGLAWGSPRTVTGAFVLVLVNFLSINFAALAVLWAMGYRPTGWFNREEARMATLKRIAALGAALLVLSTLLGGITYSTYRTATFEEETRVVVDDTLDEHASLERVSLAVTYEETFPFTRPERVTVVVGHPPGVDPPALAGPLAERVDAVVETPFRADQPIAIEIRFVVVERATAAADATARLDPATPDHAGDPTAVVSETGVDRSTTETAFESVLATRFGDTAGGETTTPPVPVTVTVDVTDTVA